MAAGREIMVVRCVADDDGYRVDCEIRPAASARPEPLRPGPYRFATAVEANAFVGDVIRTLRRRGRPVDPGAGPPAT